MSNASGFGSSSNHSEVEVKCHHQIDSKLRMVRSGSNLGKKFYGCSLWSISGQNQTWVTWVEDVGKTNVNEWEKMEGKLLEKETVIAHLEEEKKILEEKIKMLKLKRDILREAMEDMRNELCQLRGVMCKYKRGEKYALIAFVLSWLIFSIVVMVRN